MPKYLISGLPTHYLVRGDNGSQIKELNKLIVSAKITVDVNSLAELQAAFDAHCATLTGERKQCYRMDCVPLQGVRSFPGFKKATQKDGSLSRVVNKDEAIAKARADFEYCTTRKTA